jgi:RHS repeat-associated protein
VTVNGQTTTLAWDYNDKLTQITYPNSSTNSFVTDDLGHRVGKTDSGGTTSYLLDGNSVLADSRADYTRGGVGGLLSEWSGTASSFYHADQLGSTRGLTDAGQNVSGSREYDSFGLTVGGAGLATPFGFVGGEGYQSDPDSGLMLLGARYYDPSIGRFISRDPIRYRGGVNLYGYCFNNPANDTDPSGLIAPALAALVLIGVLLVGGVLAASGQEEGGARVAVGAFEPAGTIADVVEVVTGRELITGGGLSPGQRVLTGVLIAVPFIGGSVFRAVGPDEARQIAETGGAVPSLHPPFGGGTRVFPPEVAGRMEPFFRPDPDLYTDVVEFPLGSWPPMLPESPFPTYAVGADDLNRALTGPPIIRPIGEFYGW